MAAHLASLSTPSLVSPRLAPSTKAGFKPCTLVRCTTTAQTGGFSASRRPSRYQPNVWNYEFIQSITSAAATETQKTRIEQLRREVRQMIVSTNEPLAQLELIDTLDRLGIAYHFESEIRRGLESISASTKGFEDLHSASLRFRILRQYGFNVSTDVFSRFRDKSGRFSESLREDVRGLLSFYEAAHLAHEGETILEEAVAFTSEHLRARVGRVDQNLARQAQRALQVPWHRRFRRMEAREFIEVFERTDSRSQTLHELARLDFNIVQIIHQRELRELAGWWRELGLAEHISFARDGLAESYFMAVGKMFEPHMSQYRMQLARVFYLMATVEDIFGEHESVEELARFVQTVERWDLQSIDQLPQHLRIFYVAVYNTTNQIAYTVLRRHGRDITTHLKRMWVSITRSYLVEARWYRTGRTPRLEEYLSNIRTSMAAPILWPAYFFFAENIDEQSVQRLMQSESNIVHLSSTILRLSADLQRSRVGFGRGNLPRSIQIYMSEARATEEAARQHISNMLRDAWRRLNRELASQAWPRQFVNVSLNMARVAHSMYEYEDGFGVLDHESKDRLYALIAEPFQIS